MRIGYFDCFNGASGDMILGALLDAGCPADALQAELAKLKLDDATLEITRIKKQGFAATKATIHTQAPAGHRHLHHIRKIIDAAGLPPGVAARANAIFTRLAEVEAKAHNSTIEKVHFHEVGAADAIMDIVGAAVGVELLQLDRIVCSPVPVGSGTVKCEHGIMPVPAPATAALLEGVPIAATDETGELTTPTGAAILTTLADSFGPLPAMTLRAAGYGAGTRDGVTRPNLLRLLIGETTGAAGETDDVVVLEANIDDCSGEALGFALERLLAAGALDAYATPVQMKKGRPGVLLSALAEPSRADAIEQIIFAETTTFGVRRSVCRRRKLERSTFPVQSRYGPVTIKIGRRDGRIVTAAPEYEDCARAAREHDVALRVVMDDAMHAWQHAAKKERP